MGSARRETDDSSVSAVDWFRQGILMIVDISGLGWPDGFPDSAGQDEVDDGVWPGHGDSRRVAGDD
jgi:hypothetical protein